MTDKTDKKTRVPLIDKRTYKNCASWFPIVMLVVNVIAIFQTLYNCRAAYLAYGTNLAVTETLVYCGTLWGIVSMAMTFSWWMLMGVMFIIGQFIGDAVPAEPVRTKCSSIKDRKDKDGEALDEEAVLEKDAVFVLDDKKDDKSGIAMLNKSIEQQNRGG